MKFYKTKTVIRNNDEEMLFESKVSEENLDKAILLAIKGWDATTIRKTVGGTRIVISYGSVVTTIYLDTAEEE